MVLGHRTHPQPSADSRLPTRAACRPQSASRPLQHPPRPATPPVRQPSATTDRHPAASPNPCIFGAAFVRQAPPAPLSRSCAYVTLTALPQTRLLLLSSPIARKPPHTPPPSGPMTPTCSCSCAGPSSTPPRPWGGWRHWSAGCTTAETRWGM